MTDNYPEHLNPFAVDEKPKTKLTIRESFKELKKNLRQSFRIKKKETEDVQIRRKSEVPRRLPLSYPSHNEALPRSRFRERVTINDTSTSLPGPNPFDEEESNKQVTIRRRGKKRAPLPPKSLSSQNISNNLEVSSGGSHWSLTSADTDYSISTDNGSREEGEENKTETMLEEFKDFNKNMEALKDDSNNNLITKEEKESNNNIPDLVISCPKDTDKCEKDEDEETEKSPLREDSLSDISEGDNSEIIVTDITSNMIEEEKEKEIEVNKTEDPEINFCEKKSLYIAGSRDELNEPDTYTGRVSLYITGSCDDLDASNNNEVCNKSVIDENSNADAVPVPKQRKNKLSKNILLGM